MRNTTSDLGQIQLDFAKPTDSLFKDLSVLQQYSENIFLPL